MSVLRNTYRFISYAEKYFSLQQEMVKIFTRVPSYSENFITIMNISFNHFCDQFQFWQEVDSAIHVQNLTEIVSVISQEFTWRMHEATSSLIFHHIICLNKISRYQQVPTLEKEISRIVTIGGCYLYIQPRRFNYLQF